ncbi:hypothetical protein BO70DRAFT_398302 [Aspergillus heteromorphus CBS 117.55]|uniref:Uncharacterized protein n=1 Tax=Aspergillus heteromorphus CBS 117.55 TaxID=1448321 RepID=A0A317VRC7_9EURO|nr:uncharacterized protein BO70DRAFT_398302 [Aspergillus heteromorphus CBS 117.55]PWY75448.1 hypothetical protein BO70DRAFT_398302 [Aspergillus heteromorphus CBS 117.55]
MEPPPRPNKQKTWLLCEPVTVLDQRTSDTISDTQQPRADSPEGDKEFEQGTSQLSDKIGDTQQPRADSPEGDRKSEQGTSQLSDNIGDTQQPRANSLVRNRKSKKKTSPLSDNSSDTQKARAKSSEGSSDVEYCGRKLLLANIYFEEKMPKVIGDYVNVHIFTLPNGARDIRHAKDAADKLKKGSEENALGAIGEPESESTLLSALKCLDTSGLRVDYQGGWIPSLKPPGTEHLDDARPQISVGLSDEFLAHAMETTTGIYVPMAFLSTLQEDLTLISNPRGNLYGPRFPFLIVEEGENLHQAQNKAAVSGAIALRMLKGLREFNGPKHTQGSDHKQSEFTLDVVFSIVTEGSVHELWVHTDYFPDGKSDGKSPKVLMARLSAYRNAVTWNCVALSRRIQAILKWGKGEFTDKVVSMLEWEA